MGESSQYAGTCPNCGGLAFMETRIGIDDEIEIEYVCRECRNVFSSI